MIQLISTESDTSTLLRNSLLLEAEKNAHKRTASKLDTTAKLLDTLLLDVEQKWDATEELENEKAGLDYLDAAEWARDNFKRTNNRIEAVQQWVYDYLPLHNS